MSQAVQNIVKKITALFASKADPVTTSKSALLGQLGVTEEKFTSTPLRHAEVMKYTDRGILNFMGDYKGPCKTYYANPKNEDTSAAISFTTETIIADKRSFALTIHDDSTGKREREDGMVFGIYGHYKAGDDTLAVDEIIAPTKDSRNCIGAAYEIGVSPETLEKAMTFAALCAKDVYERGKIDVRACYDAAERKFAQQLAVREQGAGLKV